MGKDTHKLMLEHSKAKVELYGKYLKKYLRVISQDNHTKGIHLYDLFCGQGIYENGGIGSPIIAQKELSQLYNSRTINFPTFHLTFNDIKLENINLLKENFKKGYINPDWKIRYYNEDYSSLFPQIIEELSSFGKDKGIIFLDPKGYKEININHIKQILQNKKCEVLLFLPIRDMYRFANMKRDNISAGHEPLYKFFEQIFPNEIPKFNSPIDFINKLRKGFKNLLLGKFVDTFILEREQGQFFCMFFFTSHIRGFEKMLEAKWEIDESEGRIWRSEKSESMFSSTEVLNIEDKLRKHLTENKCFNGNLYSFSLNEGFLPKQINIILDSWQKSNLLNVFDEGGNPARKGAFYIDYNNYSSEPEKVYFQIPLTLF